jgi:hypothetical protein
LARLAYENELSNFDEMTRQGRVVTPLMRRRAGERYDIRLGKIKAIEAKEAEAAKFKENLRKRRDERLAREQKSREYRAQAKAEWEQAIQNAPPVKSIDELNAEYTKKLGADYAAEQQQLEQQRPSPAIGNMVPHRAEERADWLTPAIKNAVASAVDTLRQSPAGQLSNIAAPSGFKLDPTAELGLKFPTSLRPPAAPTPAATSDGLTSEQRDMLAKLQSGQMRPADPYALGTPQLDPRSLEASRRVSDRYRAMGVDPNNSDVYSKYASDVDRELAAMSPTGQIGAAPGPLPMGKPVGVLEGLANATFGPGGLLGPPLPPDAAERAINMAPTQNARAAAEGQAATGAMQEPFWTLAGGGLVPSMKGGAVPEMTAPGTRVIDNPTLRGSTNPTFSGPGRLGFNSNVMEVTPGRPARPVTVIPGAPGEIVDMPPTQAMPGVTPRDLPRSSGAERQGPMRPLGPSDAVVPSSLAPELQRGNAGYYQTSEARVTQGGRPLPELIGVSRARRTPIEPPKQILRDRAGLINPSRPDAEQISYFKTQSILDDLAKIGFFGVPQ